MFDRPPAAAAGEGATAHTRGKASAAQASRILRAQHCAGRALLLLQCAAGALSPLLLLFMWPQSTATLLLWAAWLLLLLGVTLRR